MNNGLYGVILIVINPDNGWLCADHSIIVEEIYCTDDDDRNGYSIQIERDSFDDSELMVDERPKGAREGVCWKFKNEDLEWVTSVFCILKAVFQNKDSAEQLALQLREKLGNELERKLKDPRVFSYIP
jgi:hypothetical protein